MCGIILGKNLKNDNHLLKRPISFETTFYSKIFQTCQQNDFTCNFSTMTDYTRPFRTPHLCHATFLNNTIAATTKLHQI